jgi:uncharacterized repeat protein (TIGR01451 family)
VVSFTITVAAGADLSTAMVATFNAIDGLVNYTITITNAGPSAAIGATVANAVPAGLTGYSWTCTGVSGGSCPTAAGSGAINFLVDLPSGASVSINAQGTYNTTTPPASITNTASVTAPPSAPDNNPGNNSASTTLTIPVFGSGFEPGAPVLALDKSGSGAWSAVAVDGKLLVDATRGSHPVEAVRYVRGDSTVVVFSRSLDGRTEARIAQRTGKALWQGAGWVAIDPAIGAVLMWQGAANGEAIEAAELRSGAR